MKYQAYYLIRPFAMQLACITLLLGYWMPASATVNTHGYKYHYISFANVPLPTGYVGFTPFGIDGMSRVYGFVFQNAAPYLSYISVYDRGVVKVLHSGWAQDVNQYGTVGGRDYLGDPTNNKFQAGLFRGTKMQKIPFLPGDTSTEVVSVNDFDSALVKSNQPTVKNIYRLQNNKGKVIFSYTLPTGSDCGCWHVNNLSMVSGAIYDPTLSAFRAIRFKPPYAKPEYLNPIQDDQESTSVGINNLGNVLGSSGNSFAPPYTNHIGIWDWKGHFTTYYEKTNFTYQPIFNDFNLIVLTSGLADDGSEDSEGYLVPKPGVRLNLRDLFDNSTDVELSTYFSRITDMNNRGDIVGYTDESGYLLQRVLPKK